MLTEGPLDGGGVGLNEVRSFLGKQMGSSPSVLHFVAEFLSEDSLLCVASDKTKQKEQQLKADGTLQVLLELCGWWLAAADVCLSAADV